VETRTGGGGRAFFLATICDLLDHGRILSVDVRQGPKLPTHPRITYIEGHTLDDEVLAGVRRTVGPDPAALVVLGAAAKQGRTMREFEAYSPLVPVGSYVVVENTILNGNPVLPEFGAGPYEAVKQIVRARPDFAIDTSLERFGLTFNPSGYLKRVS
jgi:cephalosporin hydroxylase